MGVGVSDRLQRVGKESAVTAGSGLLEVGGEVRRFASELRPSDAESAELGVAEGGDRNGRDDGNLLLNHIGVARRRGVATTIEAFPIPARLRER